MDMFFIKNRSEVKYTSYSGLLLLSNFNRCSHTSNSVSLDHTVQKICTEHGCCFFCTSWPEVKIQAVVICIWYVTPHP